MKKIFPKIRRFVTKERVPTFCLFLSFFCIICVLFGAKLPFFADTSGTGGGNVSFVVDVSKSMDASDVTQGGTVISRGDLVKGTIEKIISDFPYHSYALSVFAGEALRILPFTTDKDIFFTFLAGISYEDVSKQGTDVIKALQSGIDSFTSDQPSGVLVLFSDGGDEFPDKNLLQTYKGKLKQKNIQLIVVGVGSSQGAYIPVGADLFGSPVYKTYDGQKVVTRLESAHLKLLASSLDGAYLQMTRFEDTKGLSLAIKKIKFPVVDNNTGGNFGEASSEISLVFLAFFFFFGFVLFSLFPYGLGAKNR